MPEGSIEDFYWHGQRMDPVDVWLYDDDSIVVGKVDGEVVSFSGGRFVPDELRRRGRYV